MRVVRSESEREDLVRTALLRFELSHAQVGRQFGITRQAVQQLRTGKTYREVLPGLPRWRSCERCVHWRDGCTLGLPEVEDLGPVEAATNCEAFR